MAKQRQRKLLIYGLHKRHPGLSRYVGGSFAEAASVCLNRHHASPVAMTVTCDAKHTNRSIDFAKPELRVLKTWNNEIDTTEAGAYGVALAAVEAEEGFVAVLRAETQTGADWYVAPKGRQPDDLEDCLRLEVSGVDAGSHAEITSRLRKKVNQTHRGKSNLPAIASVVGFKERLILINKVAEKP